LGRACFGLPVGALWERLSWGSGLGVCLAIAAVLCCCGSFTGQRRAVASAAASIGQSSSAQGCRGPLDRSGMWHATSCSMAAAQLSAHSALVAVVG
jgi:hypothetical protein